MTTEPTYTGKWGGVSLPEDKDRGAAFPADFGPYVLLHRLARGGMGNVFLAKTGGVMGIEKHCVVKTLRDHYSGDADYVRQFMEEARVVVQLSHRNICPVFDVGRVGDSYYLAMELIIGQDLRRLTSALEQKKRVLPEACALHVACEMLDALDYAHRHSDTTTGEPLHLVHRDVSPQNVMISVEGEVKLIDFGLAERDRDVSDVHLSTGSGLVMGKMSYMAPEQARGEIVDPRADQFSAAVVIYEIVSGERYYKAMTQRQIWQHAGIGDVRPAGLSRLHPELRAVLERALAPAREDRFATTGDFREALLVYVREHRLHAGARELRQLVAELFEPELRETRELLRRFAHLAGQARGAIGTAVGAPRHVGDRHPARPDGHDAGHTEVLSFARADSRAEIRDPTEMFRVSPTTSEHSVARKQSSRAPTLAAAALAVAACVVGGYLITRRSAEPTAPAVPAVAELAPLQVEQRDVEERRASVVPGEGTARERPGDEAPLASTTSTAAAQTTTSASSSPPEPTTAPAATPTSPRSPTSPVPSNEMRRAEDEQKLQRKKKAEQRAKPDQPPVGVLRRADYIKRSCPKLACASPIMSVINEKRIASVNPIAFAAEVDACFDACWKP